MDIKRADCYVGSFMRRGNSSCRHLKSNLPQFYLFSTGIHYIFVFDAIQIFCIFRIEKLHWEHFSVSISPHRHYIIIIYSTRCY